MDSLPNDMYRAREFLKTLQAEAKPGMTYEIDNLHMPNSDFRNLIEEYGFQYLANQGTQFSFWKWRGLDRWEYALRGITIQDDWVCGDFGCGRNPWPRAKHLIDSSDMGEYAKPYQFFTKSTITETLPYPDKYFDFVTCFHVLEHVNDPLAALREISRVSKRGLVEVPHALKDGLLMMYESDHRWHCFPSKKDGVSIEFKAIDREWWESLLDREAQIVMDKLYLSGQETMGPSAVLRNYFRRTEEKWNIIIPWEGKIEGCIIG